VSYPILESSLHDGPPHISNDAYAYSKRMLDCLGKWYNERHQNETGDKSIRFTSVIPTNLFGKYDNFNLADGHVIPGLLHKAKIAIDTNSDFIIYGTGKPLRQFLYSNDAGHMVIWAMLNYQSEEPIMISVGEEDEISIAYAAKVILEKMNFKGQVKQDKTKSDGQYKKTASNEKFKSLYPDFKFTPFEQAVEETAKWFVDNYDTCRK
jgi:GDP-L-fucose synthase